MLLASVVCLSKQVSVTLLIPRRKPEHPLEWKCGESNPSPQYWWCNLFLKRGKRNTGFEPVTSNLEGWRSTTELISRVGRRISVIPPTQGPWLLLRFLCSFGTLGMSSHASCLQVTWWPPQPSLLRLTPPIGLEEVIQPYPMGRINPQSPRQDSNLRQRLYKSRALPTELQGRRREEFRVIHPCWTQ